MRSTVDKTIGLVITVLIALLIALFTLLPRRALLLSLGAAVLVGLLLLLFLFLYRQEYIFNGPIPRKKLYEKGEYKRLGDWHSKHKGGSQGNNRGVRRKWLRTGGRDLQSLSFKAATAEPFWRAGVELSSVKSQGVDMNTVGSLLLHIGRNGTTSVYSNPKFGLQHLQDKYAITGYCDQSEEATSPPNRLGKGKPELAPIIPEQVIGTQHEPGEIFTVELKVAGPVGARVLHIKVLDTDGTQIFTEELRDRRISGLLKYCCLMTWADSVGAEEKSREYDIKVSEIRYRAFPKV